MSTLPPNESPGFLPVIDWAGGVTVRVRWRDEIQALQGDAEVRRLLSDRPTTGLTLRSSGTAETSQDLAGIMRAIEQRAGARVLTPVAPDYAVLSLPAGIGASNLTVRATAGRRLAAGCKILLCGPSGTSRSALAYEVLTLASVGSTTLGLTGLTTMAWPAGSRAYLAVRADAALSGQADAATRGKGSAEAELTELFSSETPPARATAGSTPAGESTFAGIPILTQRINFRDVKPAHRSAGATLPSGNDQVTEVYSPTPRWEAELEVVGLDRTAAARFLVFFDSRGGRVYPFWLPSPVDELKLDAVSSGSVTCGLNTPPLQYAQDHLDETHIALVRPDGQVAIHRVTSVSSSAGRAVLAVTPSVNLGSYSLAQLTRATRARLCRFANSEMEQEWPADGVVRCRFSVVSLRTNGDAEYVPTVPDVDDPRTGDDPLDDWTADDDCSESSGVQVPMFSVPCESLALDRDQGRPVIPAADYLLPISMRITLQDLIPDPDSPNAVDLTRSLSRLHSFFDLVYDPDLDEDTGESRSWLHARAYPSPSLGDPLDWVIPGAPLPVKRRTWRATGSYFDGADSWQVDIRLVAEWNQTSPDDQGAWGAVFPLYVFLEQLFPGFDDGDSYDPDAGGAVVFSKADPAVWGPHEGRAATARLLHPQLALVGAIPTTFHSPCGADWYAPDMTEREQEREGLGPYASSLAPCSRNDHAGPWMWRECGIYFRANREFVTDCDRLCLVGGAHYNPAGELVLTAAAAPFVVGPSGEIGRRGAAWYVREKIDTSLGFECRFTFRVDPGSGDPGAGMAFVLQNQSETALGDRDGGLGYGEATGTLPGTGITRCVALELDWAEDAGFTDTGAPHVSLQASGASPCDCSDSGSLGKASLPAGLTDGEEHTVRVAYDGTDLEVYFDDETTPTLTVTADLPTLLAGTAWAGFTAGTGAKYSAHAITRWELRTTGLAGSYATAEGASKNAIFGESTGPSFPMGEYGLAAMTLGGSCPTSSLPEWICLDAHPGFTPIKPVYPGWDWRRGGLELGRASCEIRICDPGTQPEESCCQDLTDWNIRGSGRCFRLDPDTDIQDCCWSKTSFLTISLVQFIRSDTVCYDGDGNPISQECSLQSVDKGYVLAIDQLDHYQGTDTTSDRMVFKYYGEDPEYVYKTLAWTYAATATLTAREGTWTAAGDRYYCASASVPNTVLYGDQPGWGDFDDGTVSAAVKTSLPATLELPHGLAGRAATSGGDGVVLVDEPEHQVLALRRYANGSPDTYQTLGAVFTGVALATGSRFSLTFFGAAVRGSRDGFQVSGKDCVRGSGRIGVWADQAGPAYGDIRITDDDADLDTLTVTIAGDGWSASVDDHLMPGWGRNVDTGDGSPGSCQTTQSLTPADVAGVQGDEYTATPAGAHPSAEACENDTGDGCPVPLTVVFSAGITSSGDNCGTNADTRCSGFSVYFQSCIVVP